MRQSEISLHEGRSPKATHCHCHTQLGRGVLAEFIQLSWLFDHILSSDSTTEVKTQYWSRAKAQANHKAKDEGDLIS